MENLDLQQQEQPDWRLKLPTEVRLELISQLSAHLQVLSPTVNVHSLYDLVIVFESVIYQRSLNEAEYLRHYARKLQLTREHIVDSELESARRIASVSSAIPVLDQHMA